MEFIEGLLVRFWTSSEGLVDLGEIPGRRTVSCASECQSESQETPDPRILLSLSSHLFPFLLSGGSECSGLHVLSRCVGIGENIKVKSKGAQKTPGNSATCVSIYVWECQGRRDLFAYTSVYVREKRRYFYSHPVCVCVHLWFCMCMSCFVGVILQHVRTHISVLVQWMWTYYCSRYSHYHVKTWCSHLMINNISIYICVPSGCILTVYCKYCICARNSSVLLIVNMMY